LPSRDVASRARVFSSSVIDGCAVQAGEKWQQGETVLETFTSITTVANELVAEIHAKKWMPVIIAPEHYDRWLRSTRDVKDLLKPYPSELMEANLVRKPSAPLDGGPSLFFVW
jgi:putative SOS response-associated peptidase YedK